MSKALSFFGYLNAFEAVFESDDLTSLESIQNVFKCNSYEAENFVEIQKSENDLPPWSNPTFSRTNFMNCFQFLQDTDDANDCLPYRHKNIDLSTLSFLQRLAFAGKIIWKKL